MVVRFSGPQEVAQNLSLALNRAQFMAEHPDKPEGYIAQGNMQAHIKSAFLDKGFGPFLDAFEHQISKPRSNAIYGNPDEQLSLAEVAKGQGVYDLIPLEPESIRKGFEQFSTTLLTNLPQPLNYHSNQLGLMVQKLRDFVPKD